MAKFILPYNISTTPSPRLSEKSWLELKSMYPTTGATTNSQSSLGGTFTFKTVSLSHYVTAPGGGTGNRIPRTPCVAPWIFVVLYYENRDHRCRGGGVFLRH